ncbi:multidrug resistance outer membrane protein [Escherichia coli]|uniref:Multidrug resistance outer membrane protein n=1 Tax=Escherichia coli TaxID=562 RepID=A0A2X1NDQ6_ECOLX|nr:multidrug resistance outer membrane protein [Escherichia coli]
MINRQLSRLLLCSILGSTTLISGCALVRKDSAPHQQLKPEQIKLADDIHLASSGWPQAQWWKQLNDPQLDALIQRTLSGFTHPRRKRNCGKKKRSPRPIC